MSFSFYFKMSSFVSFKIIIVGASGSGKSSILEQYVNKRFLLEQVPTIGVDNYIKSITLHPETEREQQVKMVIWDTAG